MAETKKVKPKPCGNPDCGVSSGICGSLTFGTGDLDSNGYWERPCWECAAAHHRLHPEDQCWPGLGTPRLTANVRHHFTTKDAAEAFIAGVEFTKEHYRNTEDIGGFCNGPLPWLTTLGVEEVSNGWDALILDRNMVLVRIK